MKNLAVLFVVALGLVAPVRVGTQPPAFQPLTDASLQAAIQEGQSSTAPLFDLLTARASHQIYVDEDGNPVSVTVMLALMERAPFDVIVMTPYRRAMWAAREAKRKFADAPMTSAAFLNEQGVIFQVSAGENFQNADVITDFVIKKGDQVIRPARKAITPTTIQNSAGASKASAVGEFAFQLGAMPSFPFEVICVGEAGNYRQTIVAADAPQMK